MNRDKLNKDYEPFCEEWKAEMMKMRKADLIEWLRRELIANQYSVSLSIYGRTHSDFKLKK